MKHTNHEQAHVYIHIWGGPDGAPRGALAGDTYIYIYIYT